MHNHCDVFYGYQNNCAVWLHSHVCAFRRVCVVVFIHHDVTGERLVGDLCSTGFSAARIHLLLSRNLVLPVNYTCR